MLLWFTSPSVPSDKSEQALQEGEGLLPNMEY